MSLGIPGCTLRQRMDAHHYVPLFLTWAQVFLLEHLTFICLSCNCGTSPFALACRPLESRDLYTASGVRVPHTCQISTIQQFVIHGEDLEEAADEGHYSSLLSYEAVRGGCIPKEELASTWIFENVLPSSYTCSIDKSWWNNCLMVLVRELGHPALTAVIEQCDLDGVRYCLLYLMSSWLGSHEEPPFYLQGRFDFITQYTDGFSFTVEFHGTLMTPLSRALKSGIMFSNFRIILADSKWDEMDIIRAEVSFQNNAWTEQALIAVFDMEFCPTRSETRSHFCTFCKLRLSPIELIWDYPWQRITHRIRDGIALDAPDDDQEIILLNVWEVALKACEAEKCWNCFLKEAKDQWPFIEWIS